MRQGFIYLLRAGIGMLAFATAVAADGLTERCDVLPSDAELEARGAHIGTVTVRIAPIFDTGAPGEDKALFRLANHLHVDTRESTLRAQLLFKSGDPYTRRVLDETERHLRMQRFIREPQIRVVAFHDGLVDVEVLAHDLWTMSPGVSFGRAGGANSGGLELEDSNVLGFGKQVTLRYGRDVDRTSYTAGWRDPALWGSRWRGDFFVTQSDDGRGYELAIERPFYSLDTRWSGGVSLSRDASVERFYALGHAFGSYEQDGHIFDAHVGWSRGLQHGWTHRWTAGLRQDFAHFAPRTGVADIAPAIPDAALPMDRQLIYPYLRFEALEDDFAIAHNLDQIARTEDLHFGTQFTLELGSAAQAFGSDRSAEIVGAAAGRGFRLSSNRSLFISSELGGRFENGGLADALAAADARYYWRTSPRTMFFAEMSGAVGRNLDADHAQILDGASGLRGYPLRFQFGSSRALLTLEERVYTKWSVLNLAQVGAAVFVDVGRTWGPVPFDAALAWSGSPASMDNLGTLADCGFGLRLGNMRSALANVLHLDVAVPLQGSSSMRDVQFLVQTKHSF